MPETRETPETQMETWWREHAATLRQTVTELTAENARLVAVLAKRTAETEKLHREIHELRNRLFATQLPRAGARPRKQGARQQ